MLISYIDFHLINQINKNISIIIVRFYLIKSKFNFKVAIWVQRILVFVIFASKWIFAIFASRSNNQLLVIWRRFEKWFLHYNNAPAHSALSIRKFCAKNQTILP